MSDAITLDAESLLVASGFDDGGLLDDVLQRAGYDVSGRGEKHLFFGHEVLARCVERFLLPAVPVHIKNPIRAEPTQEGVDVRADQLRGLSVSVRPEDVLAIAAEVAAEREVSPSP